MQIQGNLDPEISELQVTVVSAETEFLCMQSPPANFHILRAPSGNLAPTQNSHIKKKKKNTSP